MSSKTKKIAILGSTGSIGDSALKVVRNSNGDFKVVGLTTAGNIQKLAEQIKTFRPSQVGIVNGPAYRAFVDRHPVNGVKVYGGTESLERVATAPGVDLVLSGVVGGAGLRALLAALKMGRTVALANKESLVMAGELVTRTAKKYGATLLPVDSEHSAMFQCIEGHRGNKIHKIILTASGGPFYRYEGNLSEVSVEKALAHPNWVIGKNVIPWAKTKPFGNKPAPKKTLHGSGGYRSAFLGGAGAIQRVTANSVEVGVDPVMFPMVKIHQGRYASRRVKPKEKVKKLGPNYGQWTMRWFLGLTYGVWIKNSKLSKGVLIPRRRVSLATATKKEISTYLARDIKARIRGGASL
jgi:hypothetical protein